MSPPGAPGSVLPPSIRGTKEARTTQRPAIRFATAPGEVVTAKVVCHKAWVVSVDAGEHDKCCLALSH
jgi:hypothetical protein